jgi:hypothetical protein
MLKSMRILLYCAQSIPVTITMAVTSVGCLQKTENMVQLVTLTSICGRLLGYHLSFPYSICTDV